ncbi:PCTP-like protein-like, partial [Scleropages formosus]
CCMVIKDVSAATMYDVLHDSQYRKKWDPTVLESFDIARLTANADVGYYACESRRPPAAPPSPMPLPRPQIHPSCASLSSGPSRGIVDSRVMLQSQFPVGVVLLRGHHDDLLLSGLCPKPLKNRDVVTLRSWMVTDDEYLIVNYSVKHPKFPPRKDLVRAVSVITGYMLKVTGPSSCIFTYLSQADPKGSLPKWVVNKASQVVAPKVLKCAHKAGQNYPEWKEQNSPNRKPWLYPEQNDLPRMDPSELTIQRADSLENVDESSSRDPRENEVAEDSN